MTTLLRSTLLALVLSNAVHAACAADFAIVKLDGSGSALLISAAPIAPDATVALQYPDAKQQTRCCKQLRGADLVAVQDPDLLASDELLSASPRLYKAKVPADWADMPFIGLAASGSRLQMQSRRDGLEVRDSAGITRTATLCTSAEGVHLKESVKGQLRTHLYLSLGYEIESPSCR